MAIVADDFTPSVPTALNSMNFHCSLRPLFMLTRSAHVCPRLPTSAHVCPRLSRLPSHAREQSDRPGKRLHLRPARVFKKHSRTIIQHSDAFRGIFFLLFSLDHGFCTKGQKDRSQERPAGSHAGGAGPCAPPRSPGVPLPTCSPPGAPHTWPCGVPRSLHYLGTAD